MKNIQKKVTNSKWEIAHPDVEDPFVIRTEMYITEDGKESWSAYTDLEAVDHFTEADAIHRVAGCAKDLIEAYEGSRWPTMRDKIYAVLRDSKSLCLDSDSDRAALLDKLTDAVKEHYRG